MPSTVVMRQPYRRKYRKYRKYGKRNVIPKYMSKRDKMNLRKNLSTLGEKKYFVTSFANTVDSTGAVLSLSEVPIGTAGTTDLQRDGDQIGIRSLEVNAEAYNASTVPFDDQNIVRLIIFQWFPTTTPTKASVLNPVSVPVLEPIAAYAHDNRFNFKILMDKKFLLSQQGPQIGYTRKYIIGGFKEKIQFSGGGLTGTNKIYALYVSDSGAINHPFIAFTVKLNYSDY